MLPAVLLATAAAEPTPGPLMAVLELRNKLKEKAREEIDAGYLTDVVRATALQSVPGLRVMTRENMMVLLESAGKKLADCEGECEVDTGRKLGADLVITGDVLRFGSAYKLVLRLHETRGGQLLSGAQAAGATADELDRHTKQAVVELLASLRSAAAAPKTACKVSLPEEGCPRHSELKGTFDDSYQGSEHDQGMCLKRAGHFHNYCGSTQIVTSSFIIDGKPAQSKNTRRRCDVTLPKEGCPAHEAAWLWAKEAGTFDDVDSGADDDPARCTRRASELAGYCGSTQQITARFVEDGKIIASGTGDRRCQIALSAEGCPKHPEQARLFADFTPDGSDHDAKRCMRRAAEFRNWCGSTQVSATFFEGNKPVVLKDTSQRCDVTLQAEGCPSQRDNADLLPWSKEGGTLDDSWEGADGDRARCMRRASDYVAWCGSNQVVIARFVDNGTVVATQRASSRCEVALPAEGCPAHKAEIAGTFNDQADGADRDQARCLRRASEWRDWCASTQQVSASFLEGGKVLGSTRAGR